MLIAQLDEHRTSPDAGGQSRRGAVEGEPTFPGRLAGKEGYLKKCFEGLIATDPRVAEIAVNVSIETDDKGVIKAAQVPKEPVVESKFSECLTAALLRAPLTGMEKRRLMIPMTFKSRSPPSERSRDLRDRLQQGAGFTLTRLHARYGKESLGEDLVFKEAPPIAGGRETRLDDGASLERGSKSYDYNNFQGRYPIRHPWTGPIACSDPKRGVWGGPPQGQSRPAVKPAVDLAFVARDGSLEGFLKQDVPELGISGKGPGLHDVPTLKEKYPGTKNGCQCRTGDKGPASGQPLWGALLALGALLRRRCRFSTFGRSGRPR